ncbi:uncharacterized protein METZ01_LOCUS374994, partial [marine metagenome]
ADIAVAARLDIFVHFPSEFFINGTPKQPPGHYIREIGCQPYGFHCVTCSDKKRQFT